MNFRFRCTIIRPTIKKQSDNHGFAGAFGRCRHLFYKRACTQTNQGVFQIKIEEVQAQNLSDSRIEENNVKELNQLGISYNKMLERLSDAFEIQRQFTANAAHELRTPLALMQVQLDLYNSASHPGNDADIFARSIKMVTEQNDKLNRMVKTLLDMSELQTVGRMIKLYWMLLLKRFWQILSLLPWKRI